MIKFSWPAVLLFSSSLFAVVNHETKVKNLELLQDFVGNLSVNLDVYERDLQYELKDLSFSERAQLEANLLTEKISLQVQKTYFEKLEELESHEAATSEVQKLIEKDIQLISTDLQDEIRNISFRALEDVNKTKNIQLTSENLQEHLLEGVVLRSQFLNQENNFLSFDKNILTSDETTKSYLSTKDLVKELVSEKPSVKFITTSSTSVKTDALTNVSSQVGVQLKASFLGVSVDAGPTIKFSRKYKTSAVLQAEGLEPLFNSDGNFSLHIQDSSGKRKSRTINFNCEASLEFSSEYIGAGGFSLGVVSARSSASKTYSNSVMLYSRRLTLPDSIGGKRVNISMIRNICHDNFLNANLGTSRLTVANSLDVMMTNMVTGLHFSHPQTTCLIDDHCFNWFNYEIIAFVKLKNRARCVEDPKEGFRTCQLRGLKGQNCTVLDSQGKRISAGGFEYRCDRGLTCVKTQEEGWFKNGKIYQHAVGTCLPREQ